MKKIKNKIQISTSIFVTISIVNLILLAILFSFLKIMIFKDKDIGVNKISSYERNYDESDPFITKTSNFKKILKAPEGSTIDPSIGDNDAGVVITMYTDIMCNYCYEQEKNIRAIIEEYKGGAKLILKNYPEIKIESLSWQATVAERCAKAQNSFWEYHDLIYKNLESLSRNKFIEIAKSLNLNINNFNNCMNSEGVNKLVINNIVEARALRIKGLPTIYINDKEISSKINKEKLINKIDIEILNMKDLNKNYE